MTENSNYQPSIIKELLIGYCLGTANIIPGVSGGTFLLIFRIYERVFEILSRINKSNMVRLASVLLAVLKRPGTKSIKAIQRFLTENDFLFLIKLLVGSVVAIVSLSSLMKYLIVNHFEVTYALFFGLIFLSIIIPVRMLKHHKPWLLLFAAAGCLATIYVTVAVNPYDKVRMKSHVNKLVYDSQKQDPGTIDKQPETASRFFSYSGKYTVNEYLYAGLSGAASISAMVLPGVSGSLVLILMGQYFEVVSAISALKTLNLDAISFLTCFGVGLVFGGLLFARLISLVLKKYYNATMAFLTGLMLGSLYALWPFKKYVIMPEQYVKQEGMIRILENVKVYTNVNIWVSDIRLLTFALVAFAAGCWIMSFFVRHESQ